MRIVAGRGERDDQIGGGIFRKTLGGEGRALLGLVHVPRCGSIAMRLIWHHHEEVVVQKGHCKSPFGDVPGLKKRDFFCALGYRLQFFWSAERECGTPTAANGQQSV